MLTASVASVQHAAGPQVRRVAAELRTVLDLAVYVKAVVAHLLRPG